MLHVNLCCLAFAIRPIVAVHSTVAPDKMCMQQEGLCEQVLALLLASCEGEEECRNVVAECMGHLALLNPTQVRPFSRVTA